VKHGEKEKERKKKESLVLDGMHHSQHEAGNQFDLQTPSTSCLAAAKPNDYRRIMLMLMLMLLSLKRWIITA
jgi:hypothetical protein